MLNSDGGTVQRRSGSLGNNSEIGDLKTQPVANKSRAGCIHRHCKATDSAALTRDLATRGSGFHMLAKAVGGHSRMTIGLHSVFVRSGHRALRQHCRRHSGERLLTA